MEKRLKLQCWNCPETYRLLRETEGVQIVVVKCPFCNAEAEVDLKPYLSPTRTIMRGGNDAESKNDTLKLPDSLPTRPRKE